MVPDIASKGHSFNGAMLYYLHDKRQEGEAMALSTERVEWIETRNLATQDPHVAKSVMIATARSADELKAAAGIKTTGRKSSAHVYAYSLAWHPDERGALDRAEMNRAVDQSLKALGADHLQAVLVCHRDQKHPHVHVILNRVDPATGKMHGFSNDRLILSDWANAYERERGQILTPIREEKRQLREQFSQADRRQHVAQRPKPEPSPAVMLRDMGTAQKVAHSQQWADLSARQKAATNAIYATYGAKITEAADRHKAESKGALAQHFREARAQEKAFADRERGFAGRIRNALDAVTQQQITGAAGDRGRLSLMFNNVLSSQARTAAFTSAQEITRAGFNKALRERLDGQITALKAERSAALSRQRDSFTADRAALIQKQDAERAKIREAWKQLKDRTPRQVDTRAIDGTRSESPDTKAARIAAWKTRQQVHERRSEIGRAYADKKAPPPSAPQEKPAVKDAYDKANRIPAPPKAPEPTRTVSLSMPNPAPSPSGVTRVPERRAAEVPAVDRAAAWAKTAQGQKIVQEQGKPAPAPARKDWSAAATPTPAAVAPKKDWSAVAQDRPREIKPLPVRDKSRDYDRER